MVCADVWAELAFQCSRFALTYDITRHQSCGSRKKAYLYLLMVYCIDMKHFRNIIIVMIIITVKCKS